MLTRINDNPSIFLAFVLHLSAFEKRKPFLNSTSQEHPPLLPTSCRYIPSLVHLVTIKIPWLLQQLLETISTCSLKAGSLPVLYITKSSKLLKSSKRNPHLSLVLSCEKGFILLPTKSSESSKPSSTYISHFHSVYNQRSCLYSSFHFP